MTRSSTAWPPRHTDRSAGQVVARRLADHLRSGGVLHPRPARIALPPGEVAYAEATVAVFRFCALAEVTYQRAWMVPAGPLGLLTAAICVIGNRQRRQDALRLAAPQWRAHGWQSLTVTNRRLIVHGDHDNASLWFTAIQDLLADIDQGTLDLTINGDHPWRFTGPGATPLAVTLDYLTGRRTLTKICPSQL